MMAMGTTFGATRRKAEMNAPTVGLAVALLAAPFTAQAGSLQSAVDLCLSERLTLASFTERADGLGLQVLDGDEARAAFSQIGDGVFMYRAADDQPDPAAAQELQNTIRANTSDYWGNTPANLRAIFALADDGGYVFIQSTPSFGVSMCRIYAAQDVPVAITASLGPRTLLTRDREPYIVTQEHPLDGRSTEGFVEAVHTPSAAYFEGTLRTPLSFTHIIEIETPSAN
ncbi:MAG: hypothetical protein AAGL89_13850 [Pseudomonadota bacterium]